MADLVNARAKEIIEILVAVGEAPPECADCAAFCAEGHISYPCKGDFDCDWLREQRGEVEEDNG